MAVFTLFIIYGSTEAKPWGGGVSFNYFYSTLTPYGEWIELDDGLFAWHPYRTHRHWQPYTVGRWVWSDYGWYWDSYEPYGWAVYHYGRWYYDEYYGWIWIPDYDWGPAWVEWRYSDDFIGWAPLPPYAVFRPEVGIRFTIDWHFPARYWNYVSCDHFHDYEINRYLIPERTKYRVYNETRYRTSYDYRDGRVINRGVDRDFVERRSGRPVVERNITETTRLRDFEGSRNSGNDRNRIEVYRPSQQDVDRVREVPNMEIRRTQRSTSLDLSKIEKREIGREVNRREINRTETSRPEVSRPEVSRPAEPQRNDRQSVGERQRPSTYERPEPREDRNSGIRNREAEKENPRTQEARPEMRPQPRERRTEEVRPEAPRQEPARSETPGEIRRERNQRNESPAPSRENQRNERQRNDRQSNESGRERRR